ncbi:MAG: type II toxin-antitoxin system RelE/ParE family toxin [Treponema sp.]|nr:type II toxin-antitoxin system RelE/ParE family toxin [Treponema sp.]
MLWEIKYHPLAEEELAKLDGSVRKIVLKGIVKVSANPRPQSEGGYGKPLGNKAGNDLTGLLKIKYRDIGIRVVYKLMEDEKTHKMYILVISARADNEVYVLAGRRKQ